MPTIKLDKDKAVRLIAQYLLEKRRFSPEDANKSAAELAGALLAGMSSPTKPGLKGLHPWKMIGWVPHDPTLLAEIVQENNRSEFNKNIDVRTAENIWRLVYLSGRDLPEDVDL